MARANSGPVPVVVVGLGAIGREIARASLQSEEVTLVAAVDTHPALVGKRLDELGVASPIKVEPGLRRSPARGPRRWCCTPRGRPCPPSPSSSWPR
jgi:4-hydroxy-tetrahydrodipicolinate reductase